jgi:hypothetical protein
MPDNGPSIYLQLIYRRVLNNQDASLTQVCFHPAVLDKYRGAAGYSLIRTDSAGRIRREGGWSLDLGIGDGTVHANLRDVMANIPEAERGHWAEHVVALPLSANFLQMQLAPNSCFDDGEVRPWD